MITVNLTRLGDPVSDFEAEAFADRVARSYDSDSDYRISSQLAWDMVRLFVRLEKIKAGKVQMQFEGKEVKIDAEGNIVDAPPGFVDLHFSMSATAHQVHVAKLINSLTEEEQHQYIAKFNEYLDEIVKPIMLPGTQFYLDPHSGVQHKRKIDKLSSRSTFTVDRWEVQEGSGTYICVLKPGNRALDGQAISELTYDLEGFKMILQPFDTNAFFRSIGKDPVKEF